MVLTSLSYYRHPSVTCVQYGARETGIHPVALYDAIHGGVSCAHIAQNTSYQMRMKGKNVNLSVQRVSDLSISGDFFPSKV